jgi:hypothetical protein
LLFILFYTFFYWIFSSILPLIIWFHLVLYQIRFLFFYLLFVFFHPFPKFFFNFILERWFEIIFISNLF